MARPSGRDIRGEVIEAATDAIRARGVDGFSYGDLAERVGIRAPSIHHHFGRKDDLIAATTSAYRRAFRSEAESLAPDDPVERLQAYAGLFLRAAVDGEMCLCGAVAAAWDHVDESTRAEVSGFFRDELRWVEDQLRAGQAGGAVAVSVDVEASAVCFLGALEGSLLLARTGTPPGDLERATDALLVALSGQSPT